MGANYCEIEVVLYPRDICCVVVVALACPAIGSNSLLVRPARSIWGEKRRIFMHFTLGVTFVAGVCRVLY